MKKITLTPDNRFAHWVIDSKPNPPGRLISVTDELAMLLSQNAQTKVYDSATETVNDYIPTFILSDAQAIKIAEINASTKLVIVSGFASDALGASHLYQSEQEDQLNLAGIAGNGQDRVFKCSSDNGVTWSYQMHTAAQLNQVASDGIDFKTAALVAGETAKNQVRNLPEAATQDDIDAIEVVY